MADLNTLRPEVSSAMRTVNGEAGGNRDDAYEVIEAELLRLSAVEQKWKQWINDGMRVVVSEQPK